MGVKDTASCSLASCLVFIVALSGGTVATLSSKAMFGFTTTDSDGNEMQYERPLMQTLIMFFAMSLAIPLYYGHLAFAGIPFPRVATKMWFILALPACTDMLGTMFAMIGLLYVTVSVYQLVRCFVIVFVALLKVFVLGSKLRGYHWLGVVMNATAVICVSASALTDPDVGDDALFGIGCIILGCAVMATQLVIEEKVMTGDETPPLVVVGMEGVWGTLIMLCVIYPIAYCIPGDDHGSYENLYESMIGIWNNSALFNVAVGYLIAITTYNVAAIFITFLLESVWRSILENFRPIAVWGCDLALFYLVTAGAFGEEWVNGSWLEAGGLVVLLIGTATYNGKNGLEWPCFEYPPDAHEDEEIYLMSPTPDRLASPMVIRSPAMPRKSFTGHHTGYDELRDDGRNTRAVSVELGGSCNPGYTQTSPY